MMLSVLAVAAVALGISGAWFVQSYAERAADRVLRSAATAISETLAAEQGKVRVAVPAGAFSFLEDSGKDSVFYNVTQGDRIITGYRELGIPDISKTSEEETSFRYGEIFGQEVRIATQIRRLPPQDVSVSVQVAETLTERRSQSFQMLAGLITLELVLIMIPALLVRPAVRWGLKPITRLRDQLVAGDDATADVAPLDTRDVPIELRDLVDAFNQLLARLGEALGAHRKFTGDASHQMRTPLAVLKTHVALLKRGNMGSNQALSSIKDIETAGNRLERLLSQLLSLARAEGGASSLANKRVKLGAMTADICRRVAPDALAARVDIQFECPRDFVIMSQPLIIEEILTNLIDNAVRYNNAGGTVLVRVGQDGDAPYIEVEDSGPGIAADDRANVFQRFHRLNRDQNKAGSGLGLPIAKALAESIFAKLSLEDRFEGSGCRFKLVFSAA